MSKAFTKDDAPDAPPVVPARAPLPAGVPNYVTARGLGRMRTELTALEATRATADSVEGERRTAILEGRIAQLAARLGSAVVVPAEAHDEVRFGATVTLHDAAGAERRYQIVGVDEASAAEGRVAFVAPIARAVLGRRVGETISLRTARGEEDLVIAAIAYEQSDRE